MNNRWRPQNRGYRYNQNYMRNRNPQVQNFDANVPPFTTNGRNGYSTSGPGNAGSWDLNSSALNPNQGN